MSRGRRKTKSGGEQLLGGFTLVAVFGLLYFSTHQWLWLIPVCCVGLPAVVRGMERVRAERVVMRQRRSETPRVTDADRTKAILRVAQANKGRVTPAIVTLNSSVSLDEAERLLQDLAKKGYAGMNVTESGRIEYEFPEFMDRTDETS